ncbi:hypothetical protein [Chryseobacterium sp. Mn2064]|uniref:hypothetical protein n=1 Tax=Chryseobacterium sp. Mn2064 TaxID=3395263 RepID=UPI003BDDECD3
MITLINAIEVSPLAYAKYPPEDYELPSAEEYPDPEEWHEKWEESASKLNFNFKPIEKGSPLVDIENIDDGNLQMIIEGRLADRDPDDPDGGEFMLAFDGGLVLKQDNQVHIHPNCCGDMSDIQNWKNIFENKTSEWALLWIGHPWVLYKRENGIISFSEYTESNAEDLKDIKITVEIEETELRTQLDTAIQRQFDFKNRLLMMLTGMRIENAENISKMLSGM